MNMLPREELQKIFTYRNGSLYWRTNDKRSRGRKGLAARPTAAGPNVISVAGTTLLEHRVIYFMEHGVLPPTVHHEDQIRSNNKLKNLKGMTAADHRTRHAREIVQGQHSREGFPLIVGVTAGSDPGYWEAWMGRKYLGRSTDYRKVVQLRLAAEKEKYGEMPGLDLLLGIDVTTR